MSHADTTGHDDHGHDDHADESPIIETFVNEAGEHTFPPAPASRWITPASEDFEHPPRPSAYLWPVFWVAVALLAGVWVFHHGWQEIDSSHGDTVHEHPER